MSLESEMKNSINNTRLSKLRDRAEMMRTVRDFFYSKDVLEVDCPLITQAASVDAHIDLIPTIHPLGTRFLHSSPEYGMKRLLAEGIGDIFQLGHVFRQEEVGAKHNPEFLMAEWYRLDFSFEEMIEETVDFVRLFIGPLPCRVLSYREAFLEFTKIDPFTSSIEDLLKVLTDAQVPLYEGIENESKDNVLNLILGILIEPHLGQNEIVALAYYPSTQAALAKTRAFPEGAVAERFELYVQGIELANGYHELTDAQEQRQRFIQANQERLALGKERLPIDELFLSALEKGIPDCCGVAVGVDRLMMLRHQSVHIAEIMPFSWKDA